MSSRKEDESEEEDMDEDDSEEFELEDDKATGEVFIVESLLRHRYTKKGLEFLVKWQGWSEKHNSWEPEGNVLDQRLIDFYWSVHPKAAEKRMARLDDNTRSETGGVRSALAMLKSSSRSVSPVLNKRRRSAEQRDVLRSPESSPTPDPPSTSHSSALKPATLTPCSRLQTLKRVRFGQYAEVFRFVEYEEESEGSGDQLQERIPSTGSSSDDDDDSGKRLGPSAQSQFPSSLEPEKSGNNSESNRDGGNNSKTAFDSNVKATDHQNVSREVISSSCLKDTALAPVENEALFERRKQTSSAIRRLL